MTSLPAAGRWRSCLRLMLAGLLWLAAVSAARYLWTGSISPVVPRIPVADAVVLHLLMAPGLLGLGFGYLGLWLAPPPYEARRELGRWAFVLGAAAALALPLSSNDVFTNLAFGRMAQAGLELGRFGPVALPAGDPFRALVDPYWLDATFAYGPVSRVGFAWAAANGSVWTSLLAYKAIFLVVTWAIVAIGYRACEATLPPERVPEALVLLIVNPLLLWEVAGQGHNDGVMVLFALAAMALVLLGRVWLSWASLAVGILAKSAVAPMALLLAASGLPRLRGRVYWWACAAGTLAVAGILWATPELALAIDAPLQGHDVTRRLHNSVPSLVYWAAGAAGPGVALAAYRVYWVAALALVGAAAAWYGRRTDGPQAVAEHSLRVMLLLVLAFSPRLHPWYLTWLLPFAPWATSAAMRRLVAIVSVAFLLLIAVPIAPVTWVVAAGSLTYLALVLRQEAARA